MTKLLFKLLFDGEGTASEGNAQGEDLTGNTQPNSGDDITRDADEISLEDKRKAYNDLIRGEYKQFYTEDTQKMIDRRFKETKNLQAQLEKQNSIIEVLNQKYGVSDIDGLTQAIDNDYTYWQDAADEAGMSVEQYKEFTKLQRENKALLQKQADANRQQLVDSQMNKWMQEADAIKAKFKHFDLEKEVQNPQFMNLLKAGTPMEHAYKVIHMDEILTDAITTTQANTEKAVVENVRAKGNRPLENGTASQSAFQVREDVSKLTKQQRADIAKRVRMGESISFGK